MSILAHFVKNMKKMAGLGATVVALSVGGFTGAQATEIGTAPQQQENVTGVANATFQPIDGGAVVSNGFSSHAVTGDIYNAWITAGYPTALSGTPVHFLLPYTDQVAVGDGVKQSFSSEGGRGVFYANPTAGAHFVDVDTAAGQFYEINGGATAYGFPTGEVVQAEGQTILPTEYGAISATFQNGQMVGTFIPNPAGN